MESISGGETDVTHDQPAVTEARSALEQSKKSRARAARQQRGDWRVIAASVAGLVAAGAISADGPRLIFRAVLILALSTAAALLLRRSSYRARWLDSNMGFVMIAVVWQTMDLVEVLNGPVFMSAPQLAVAAAVGTVAGVLVAAAGTAAAKVGLR